MNTSFDHKDTPKNQRHSQHESQSAKTHPSRTIVHAKLEMTDPGDHDEQEADAMAEAVVSGGKISRKISGGGGGSSGIAVSQQMESQLSQLQGGGRPMPQGLLNMMESGFGQDFGHVRIHTDAEAADMSSSISAKAFTLGNDIYFNRGQFNPETTEGQRLVAHELTHVVQGTGKVGRKAEGRIYETVKKEIDHYIDKVDKVKNALNIHMDLEIEKRPEAKVSRLFGGEKDFSYRLMFQALDEAKTILNSAAKRYNESYDIKDLASAVVRAGIIIDILDDRFYIYKNNIQAGAEIAITNLYITKTVSFGILSTLSGVYFSGLFVTAAATTLGSAVIGGATGGATAFIDSGVTELSKELNGIESNHLENIAVSTTKGVIFGTMGSFAGKALEGTETAAQIFFNSGFGITYSIMGDIATHDFPIEKQRKMEKEYYDFIILLSTAWSVYGICWHTKEKKFVQYHFTQGREYERKLVLKKLNNYIKEFPNIIDHFDQLPVKPATTSDPVYIQ